MAEDKDDESFSGGVFEDGEWIWDDVSHGLIFLLKNPRLEKEFFLMAPKVGVTGAVHFKEIDLIEQIRFRKRYQRRLKPGQKDIISLQDIKDLVIYTAPLSIMSSTLINALHIPTTERFMRALILYCQYYLQVSQEMTIRMAELDRKIPTPATVDIENEFRNDLCDLRCLVAKEYCTLLIGGQDTRKYHHMGWDKKKKSLSEKDAQFIESLVLVCIQVVWIALGRRSFNQLERRVLLGNCLLHEAKLCGRSPLINEVICIRQIDYRMFGIGTIQYKELPTRLDYMLAALTAPEEALVEANVTIGILGQPRSCFDTALYLLAGADDKHQSKTTRSSGGVSNDVGPSKKNVGSTKSVGQTENMYGYKNIELPRKCPGEPPYPPFFPDEDATLKACSEMQRRRWVNRLYRLTHLHEKHCSEYNN